MILLAIILTALGGLLVWLGAVRGLPGVWVFLGLCTLVDWLMLDMFETATLVVGFAIAAVGEIIEWVSGDRAAKKAGASKGTGKAVMWGGIIGAIAGSIIIPIPVVGGIIGSVVGVAAGVFSAEDKAGTSDEKAQEIMEAAVAAHLRGMAWKLGSGALCWLFMSAAAFIP